MLASRAHSKKQEGLLTFLVLVVCLLASLNAYGENEGGDDSNGGGEGGGILNGIAAIVGAASSAVVAGIQSAAQVATTKIGANAQVTINGITTGLQRDLADKSVAQTEKNNASVERIAEMKHKTDISLLSLSLRDAADQRTKVALSEMRKAWLEHLDNERLLALQEKQIAEEVKLRKMQLRASIVSAGLGQSIPGSAVGSGVGVAITAAQPTSSSVANTVSAHPASAQGIASSNRTNSGVATSGRLQGRLIAQALRRENSSRAGRSFNSERSSNVLMGSRRIRSDLSVFAMKNGAERIEDYPRHRTLTKEENTSVHGTSNSGTQPSESNVIRIGRATQF